MSNDNRSSVLVFFYLFEEKKWIEFDLTQFQFGFGYSNSKKKRKENTHKGYDGVKEIFYICSKKQS